MHTRSIFLAVATAMLLGGCASEYKLGTTLAPELRDVYVPTVLNESDQPDAARVLQRTLVREIQREGTLRMVPEREAATRLDVVVTKYEQTASTYSKNDTQHPSEYRMTLTARVSFAKLPRAQAGETDVVPIWSRSSVSGSETFEGGAGAVSAKLACLPEAAQDLAETIVDGCVGAW
ncbi:MAG: LptE family protein [Kiritimatiellae bacterium]|nr:LptE family protein [Kiritimatiellia bacterium]